MDSVGNIPELLEEILIQLPFLDLVTATRVNHTWRDFIYSSVRLQRKLFSRPTRAPAQEDDVDKHGMIGRWKSHKYCLYNKTKKWTATLCPYLLTPGYDRRSAHLTERAVRADSWPYMHLTNPPCAHAHVYFTYKGISEDDTLVIVEGGRSLYRWDGVTIAAIDEALYQSGAVKVREIVRWSSTQSEPKVLLRQWLQNTTLSAEVASCEEYYSCKMAIDVAETRIRLHCETRVPDGVASYVVPFRFKPMVYAVPGRKIRFEE